MNKKTKFIIISLIGLLLIAVGISTYAYFAAMTSGTSRVNLEVKTSSRASISVGNNDSVELTVLPSNMLEGLIGINYSESTEEESGNLYATISTGDVNGQTCTLTVKYEADEDYLFTRSHYCAKDGEANTYTSSCAEGYTMHTSSEITDYPEYALYLTPTVTAGYLDTGVSEVDISDINDSAETTIKTYTWKLPANATNARVDINVKARYYNLDFDQNSTADKTYTGNISLSAYCVGETAVLNQTLTKLHLSTADIIKTAPNYAQNPTLSTSGLYQTTDDYGTSLVFRGVISNNWAKFGKESVATNCTNSDGTKDIMSATGEKITTSEVCSTTYTYSCSNANTIFVGTSGGIDVCTTLGLTVSSGDVTGTYHNVAETIEKDMYWRVVRINGNGNLRMIYSGNFAPKANQTVMAGAWTQLGTTAFNTSANNNAYVGYMYGDTSRTTLDAVHANTNTSTIKTYIDNWYTNNTNLGNNTNDNIVADDYFCYDRTLYSGSINNVDYTLGTGIGTTASSYGATGRIINSTNWTIKTGASPTLICPQAKDMYTKESTTLNNKTTVATGAKMGLLSADEAIMAGATTSSNSTHYLYTGKWYWLGSPSVFITSGFAYVFSVYSYGYLDYNRVSGTSGGARPVLSVNTSYLTTGNGTAQNPWVFEITNS